MQILNKEQSIHQTINLVMQSIAKIGIGKDGLNQMQNYNYRAIDSVYNTLASILSEHGLVIYSKVLRHDNQLITTTKEDKYGKKESTTTRIFQEIEFTFYHIHNDQNSKCIRWGEAADTSDKATNKASTSAYKYMVIEVFCIPINGSDQDGDNHSPAIPGTESMKNNLQNGFIPENNNLASDEELMQIKNLLEIKKEALVNDSSLTKEVLGKVRAAILIKKMEKDLAIRLLKKLQEI